MTVKLDSERLLVAVHALTGSWMSGKDAARLALAAGSRAELLAHGLIDLGWLEGSPVAREQFGALARAAALGLEADEEDQSVPFPVAPTIGLTHEEALALAARFTEDPAAADPRTSLRRLATFGRSPSR